MPIIFNLVLEYTMWKIHVNPTKPLQYKSAILLGYADVVNVMRRSVESIKVRIESFQKAEDDLLINERKNLKQCKKNKGDTDSLSNWKIKHLN